MVIGSVANWVALGISVAVILGGQAVLWVKFKTIVERDIVHIRDDITRHEGCIASLKKRHTDFVTIPQHDKMQRDCQSQLHATLSRYHEDIAEIKSSAAKNKDVLAEIRISVAEIKTVIQKNK